MRRSTRPHLPLPAGLAAGLLMLLAAPVEAVNIPEGGAVTPGSVFVIHFQVQEGCDGAPTDALEVTIPESLENVIPEAVPGWQVETEVVVAEADEEEADPRVTTVRWAGGPLADGAFMHFGLWARFPDEPDAVIEFPVVQRCGDVERAWTGADGDMPAPTVVLQPRIGPRDLLELSGSVSSLQEQVEELRSRLGDVDPGNLRTRVSDNESALDELEGRLDELRRRISDLEDEQPS